jgi:hypothetical protein
MRIRNARTVRQPAPAPPRDRTDDEAAAVAALVALTYELLDAHADTRQLAEDVATPTEWDSHVAYLRDLQRVGRETLARVAAARSGL